uniref:Serine/threonine-protein kinase receptor n=1 Tax=Corethrella appendiculata TaxID=1370023 RepID=U5EVS8_9DIPT
MKHLKLLIIIAICLLNNYNVNTASIQNDEEHIDQQQQQNHDENHNHTISHRHHHEPLQCEKYECTNGKCIDTIETCVESEVGKAGNCFVVWSTNATTGQHQVSMKGCFIENEACNQTDCIDSNYASKTNLNFCCCKTNLCNREHKWIPKPTEAPIQDSQPIPAASEPFYMIIAFTAIFTMITIFIGLFFFCKNRRPAMFREIPTVEPETTSSTPCLPLPIQLIEMKARGRFGCVWKAQMKPEEVAVKIFPMAEKQSWITEQEIFKLPRMNHPNILQFIGAEKHTESTHTDFWLITAYHHHGSLCDYLKSHTVTWTDLCKIAETMARGLMHLHEEIHETKTEGLKPAIAHRDFKSKNVLLKDGLTACIADFGLALVFTPGIAIGDTHGQVGTRRYMAPEVLEGAINFTRDAFLRIDVYACGLVLWELVSRCTAHGGIVGDYTLPFEIELGSHPTLEEMQENVVTKKIRPRIHDHWRGHPGLSAICDTIEECWDHDAEARLSSSCVMERVSQHTKYQQTQLLIETNTDNSLKDCNDST